MDYNQAAATLNGITERYRKIPTPKYRHANFEALQSDFHQLQDLKAVLKDDDLYRKMISSIGFVLAKMTPPESKWNNISERSVNKIIRPCSKHHIQENEIFNWKTKHGNQEAILPQRKWTSKHYMVLDIVAYLHLLQRGNGNLPKTDAPLFNNAWEIELQDETAEITLTDAIFRKFSNLKKIPSKNIYRLLQEVESSQFKLNFPIRLPFHRNGKKAEDNFSMPGFDSFFSIASVRGDHHRTYEIRFNTLLGQLFIHNLQMGNCDFINAGIYQLPDASQILYRRFLLNNNLNTIPINVETIKQALGYTYTNHSDLIKTIKINAIDPLVRCNLIASYQFTDGLIDKKFILTKSLSGG